MECKCGEWTIVIKTTGEKYEDTHGNNWLIVEEYHACPYCRKQYVVSYHGLSTTADYNEITDDGN